MNQETRQYKKEKWITLLMFGMLYATIYYGRFSISNHIKDIVFDYDTSKNIELYVYNAAFLSYAFGSFFMGRLADVMQKPVEFISIGAGFSLLINMSVIFVHKLLGIIFLTIINGIFQSMIWVNGMLLIVFWWKSSDRPLSGGIANFFSGIAHIPAFFLPSMFVIPENENAIRQSYTSIFCICIILFFFFLLVTSKPFNSGFSSYEEDDELIAEKEKFLYKQIKMSKKSPWNVFLKEKKVWCWCFLAMFSSVCRYGLLEWIPKYYEAVGTLSFINEPFTNIILPIGMAFGTLGITYIAGKKFKENKGIMVAICAALSGSMISIFPMMPSKEAVLMGIFSAGFFLFGINGIIWIYAMDRAGRIYSATLVGVLNCFAYLGAFLTKFLFPAILHFSENWFSIFIFMEFLCFIMVGLMILASQKDTYIELERE